MDKEFLQDYCQKEIEHCEKVFRSEQFASASTKEKLRLLYDVPADAEVIYCETGGLENLDSFPEDKLIVLTIFPYKQESLFERHLGSLKSFLEKCRETKRIIPVLQSPLYYEELDHLEPFFTEIKSRSFFARGPYAYAAMKGEGLPKLVTNKYGHPSLVRIKELEDQCQTKHAQWLARAIRDRKCWEPRYRTDGTNMYKDRSKLSSSFVYRYASVAYCIGQDLTDDIINTFDEHRKSCAILLRLHILFDHVVANGFGSHFCADPRGVEYRGMYQPWTSLLSPIERVLCKDLEFPVLRELDEDYKELLKYHHPLEGIHLDNLGLSQIGEVRDRIVAQFEQYRKKLERLRTKKRITERVFSISLFLLGSIALLKGDPLLGGIAGTGLVAEKVFPKRLYQGIFDALENVYRHNLGCFLLSSK